VDAKLIKIIRAAILMLNGVMIVMSAQNNEPGLLQEESMTK